MRHAIYAGTFDPLTIGHQWMIHKGAEMFDHFTVAIGENPDKRCMFSFHARMSMLSEAVIGFSETDVDSFENEFLINYAQRINANFILRGIRTESDYEFERVMRNINGTLAEKITTVFLIPPPYIAEVSSSMVKGLIGPNGWEEVVKKYVSDKVFDRLKEHASVAQ